MVMLNPAMSSEFIVQPMVILDQAKVRRDNKYDAHARKTEKENSPINFTLRIN